MTFATGQVQQANALVRRFHYSKRVPGSIQEVITWHYDNGGLFGDIGNAFAAIYFSSPPTRWSEPVWELSRLVRAEDISLPLTSLIACACKVLRSCHTIDLLVSFADSTQNHHGGVYQAASWHYHGKRDARMDGLVINGTFIPGRTCNALYGTRSASRLQRIKPSWDIQESWDEGKHLYWKPLRKSGRRKAERLGLKTLPYPKPDIKTPIEKLS